MTRHFWFVLWLVAASLAGAAAFQEDFSSDPSARGWRTFGDTNLFRWNATNQNLQVTWDSSKANSYFYHLLGTIATASDSFSLSFDLRLNDAATGTDTNKPYAFEMSIGLINLVNATSTNFLRGTGNDSPNLVEFDYFPAFDIFLPTIAQVVVSTNGAFLHNHDNLQEMTAGDLFHIEMVYDGTNRRLTTTTLRNGSLYGSPQIVTVPPDFDFRVGAFSVSSYSDRNADGSILAHGIVDNIVVMPPPPPVDNLIGRFTNNFWHVRFTSRSNWLYTLERTADFQSWETVSTTVSGNGTNLFLQDTNVPAAKAFYRVRAERL